MKTKQRRPPILIWSSLVFGVALGSSALSCSSNGGGDTGGSGGSASGGATGTGGSSSSGGVTGSGGSSATGGHVGSGGTSASGGTTGSGGVSASGGTTGSGGAATGGATASGGHGGNGGMTAAGGTPAGGGRGGASGATGGAATGGGGGSSGGGGAPGKAAVMPSAGCGKTNPATGSSGSPLNVSNHQYYVKLPSGYDGQKAFPVIFMFNPTNNPLNWAEQNAGFESNGAKDGAIRVYPGPLNSSNGWVAEDVPFFQPLYNQITANFCVDKARVFAAGESSGGDFSSILGCEHADVLRSVGPCATKDVPQYPLDTTKRNCTGELTPVVIHGKNDTVVHPENGPKTRDFYAKLNHCGTSTVPVAGYTDTLSNCVQYQGCDPGYPVYWCQHTDPNYSNTNHGWPAFAPKFLWMLWSSY